MNTENRINNFTNGFQSEIEIYVKENIKDKFKDRYQDFVPCVTSRVEEVCERLFNLLKRSATNQEKFSCGHVSDDYLDSQTVELIKKIFQKKLNLVCDSIKQNDWAGNSLGNELFETGHQYSFSFIGHLKPAPFV